MIWATVSSRSCFYWMYRASPSLATKKYKQFDFCIDHLMMSICRVIPSFVGRGCLLWPVCSLGKTVSLWPCFVLYSEAKFACYSRYLLTSYFFIPVPYNEKGIFFGVLVLEDLIGLHSTVQLQLLQQYWLGHRLGLLWYWMVCLGNEQRSFSEARWSPKTFRGDVWISKSL